MSKKLQGNGLFESSRMMLFEHRDALIEREKRTQPQSLLIRRAPDEQRQDDIAARLGAALSHGSPIRLTAGSEPDERVIEGVITRHDTAGRRIRIGQTWIPLDEIADVEEP